MGTLPPKPQYRSTGTYASVLPHLRHDDSQVISEEGTELTVAGRGVAACVALTATVNVAVTTIETLPTNTITAAAVLWQARAATTTNTGHEQKRVLLLQHLQM